MNKFLLCLFLISSPLIFKAQTQNSKGALDGKTFTVDVYKEGKKKPLDVDELKFNLGKFKSKYFADWGFTKSSLYEITSIDSSSAENKIYSFSAAVINDIKETMTWSGTIAGEEIEGSAEIVNTKGVKKYSLTFNGKLKKKPGQK